MKTPKIKTQFLNYDWKESPGEVLNDLIPILKKLGVHVTADPSCAGSDSYGYILSAKPLKVKDYRKFCKEEYGYVEGNEVVDSMLKGTKLTDNSPLDKLVAD